MRPGLLLWFILASTAVAAVGVDPALPAFSPAPAPLAGELRGVGSDAMATVMARWIALYRLAHPGTTVTNTAASPSDALPALGAGRAQLAPMGRMAYREESAKFAARFGYPPLAITVARCTYAAADWPHPHAVFVNSANPLSRLTLTQVDAIFSRTRLRGHPADIVTWGQLGLTGDWADKPIVLYGVDRTKGPGRFSRNTPSATASSRPRCMKSPPRISSHPRSRGTVMASALPACPSPMAESGRWPWPNRREETIPTGASRTSPRAGIRWAA